jgi:hypothetical protein
MKVQALLMNIKNKDFSLERGLEVKKYLPIEVKKTIAQAIIYDCTSEEAGVIKVDSVQRYMSYVRYMITTHTNLDYTDEDYDALCSTKYGENNLLNAIMDCFAEDAKECTRILNLMTDDLVYENSTSVIVGKLLYSINGSLGTFIKGMKDKIGELGVGDVVPEEGVNAKQLINILNTISK